MLSKSPIWRAAFRHRPAKQRLHPSEPLPFGELPRRPRTDWRKPRARLVAQRTRRLSPAASVAPAVVELYVFVANAATVAAASAAAAAVPAVTRAAGARTSAALVRTPAATCPAFLQTLAFAAASSGETNCPHASPGFARAADARGAAVAPPTKAVPSYLQYWVRAGVPRPWGSDLQRRPGENARHYLETLVRYHVGLGDRFNSRWIQYDAMPNEAGERTAKVTFSDVIGGGSYWGDVRHSEEEAANAAADAAIRALVCMPEDQLPRFAPTAAGTAELA